MHRKLSAVTESQFYAACQVINAKRSQFNRGAITKTEFCVYKEANQLYQKNFMVMDNTQHTDDAHSYFNQTTEVGITLTGDQARLLNATLDHTMSGLNESRSKIDDTEIEIESPPNQAEQALESTHLADTEIEERPMPPSLLQLDKSLFEQRFREIRQHVLGFHSLLEKGYETVITIAGFPEFPEIRLRSISLYDSGALYIEGENHGGEWVSIFSHLNTVSYALTRQRSTQRKKSVQEIEFSLV